MPYQRFINFIFHFASKSNFVWLVIFIKIRLKVYKKSIYLVVKEILFILISYLHFCVSAICFSTQYQIENLNICNSRDKKCEKWCSG